MASRRSRVIHEMFGEVNKERKYGESRHEAKLEEMKRAVESGTKYEQPRGIYSYETEVTYKRQCKTFLRYVTEHDEEVGHFEDAKKYVSEYLQYCRDKELSAATIKTYAHAIACAYHCNVAEFGFQIPTVSRDDIKRTRNAPCAAKVSGKTKTIHEFAAATGARRGGLLSLTTDCLREGKDGHLEIFLDEKGGKTRWARVLDDKADFVRSVVEEAKRRNALRGDGCKRVFPKKSVPKKEALHQHRHEYARALYDEIQRLGENKIADRGLYRCRGSRYGDVFDRTTLAIVSYNLGHGQPDELPHEVKRVGVVVNNYLY